jgi:hypothetical protein
LGESSRPSGPQGDGFPSGSDRRIVRQWTHRWPGRFAEYIPLNPVPTSTSSPFGRSREGADWRDQKRPEPLVVATNPASSGPPQTAHFESGIAVTQEAATGLGYLSFALVV